jgi:hypothetical protein
MMTLRNVAIVIGIALWFYARLVPAQTVVGWIAS